MFSLKAEIVLNIFDYPGQNKVLKCQGMLILILDASVLVRPLGVFRQL